MPIVLAPSLAIDVPRGRPEPRPGRPGGDRARPLAPPREHPAAPRGEREQGV